MRPDAGGRQISTSREDCESQFEPWLSGVAGVEILKPAPDDMVKMWPVSKRVNSSRAPADDPTLIERIAL
jgi:putative SOS response-associated peptidase YedK